MKTWTLTNGRMAKSMAVYDLYCGDNAVLTGVPYMDAMQHVLDNGDDVDAYQEDHMSKSQTVAELREEDAQMQARFNAPDDK